MLKLLSILLSLLVLLGSAGVTVNRHFCGGALKSFALYGEADKCYQEKSVQSCPLHASSPKEGEGIRKKGCCDDDQLVFQLDVQKEAASTPVATVQGVTLPDFPPLLVTYRAPHPRPRRNTSFENYRPPPLLTDATREYQVFRI